MTSGASVELSPAVEAAVTLLRAALAAEADADGSSSTELAAIDPMVWPEVLDQLAEQRVAAPVARTADRLGLPDEIRADLRGIGLAEAQLSLRVQATAAVVVGGLNDAGIRCLTYKGVALAAATTGDPTARGGGDVDILVHPDDVPAAYDWLIAEGATFIAGYCPDPHSDLWRYGRRLDCEFPLRWRGIDIDLHWRIDRLPQIASMSFDDMWEHRQSVRIAGRDLPTLGAVDALLITCAHGTKEHWRQWRWVVDMVRQARLVEDWAPVRRRARETGTEAALAIGLAMHEHLAPLPGTLDRLPGPGPRRLADWAWQNSCVGAAPFGRVALEAQLARMRWSTATLPSGGALASYLVREGWTALDMAEFPMPRSLAWAYPLVRPYLWGRRLVTGRYGAAALAERHAQ